MSEVRSPTKRRKQGTPPNRDTYVRISFSDFGSEFDEWLKADSLRIRPPGGPGGGLCASFAGSSR